MISVLGVLETSLYVHDLTRSVKFYQELFGFKVLLQDERMCGFKVAESQVLLLFQRDASNQPNPVAGGTVPPHGGTGRLHLAFAVSADDLRRCEGQLQGAAIVVEGVVDPPTGGHSVYFRDPDGHLIELASADLWPTP